MTYEPTPIITVPGEGPADILPVALEKCNDNFDDIAEHINTETIHISSDEKDALYGTEGDADADNPYLTVLDFMEAFAIDVDGDLMEVDYVPDNYTPTVVPECTTVAQLAAHLKGLDAAIASILGRLDAHSI